MKTELLDPWPEVPWLTEEEAERFEEFLAAQEEAAQKAMSGLPEGMSREEFEEAYKCHMEIVGKEEAMEIKREEEFEDGLRHRW